MKNLILLFSLVFICSLFASGCDLAQPQNKGQGRQPVAQNAPPPVEVPPEQNALPQDAEDNTELVRAEVGFGGRGNYGTPTANNPMEIVTVPITALFRTQDRLVLQQIEHAVNLFRAEHGRVPESHEEFMEKIIQANHIQFRMPPGHEFVYEGGELKVRRPRGTQ